MEKMAYLRKEKEIVEIDFPLNKVWKAISKAITSLEWTAEETDEATHHVKVRTKGALMSYSSVLSIETTNVAENTARVIVSAETPVTTITALVDFGRTRERIDSFIEALAKQLATEEGKSKKVK